MEQIEVHGLRIAYERAGHGPPLVLVHGYVGDGWTTWHHQLEDLADEFTVVAWDAPGAGGSSDPPETLGMAGYADCLASFIDALELGQAHVAGLSFGGALTLELCHRHPNIPVTLVLASAYAGWEGSLSPDEVERRLRQALDLSELAPQKFVEALLPTMFSASTSPEDVDTFGAAMSEFHPVGFRAMARALATNLREALPLVRVPTLLVFGDEDVRAPMYVAEDLRDSIQNSTLIVLPGVGHVCNIENPERFNHEIRTFLRDHRPDDGR